MCGISGIVGSGDHKDSIERMVASIAHRGPDDRGTRLFRDNRAALGHTRLSILDLSERGHQPMGDPTGRYWITYNGEVYNFPFIRAQLEQLGHQFRSDCDTEVILVAFQVWGEDCLRHFEGMFAFAIWDEENGRLFAARDRLGIKPFYYAQTAHGFVFSSEIKAILASGRISAEPDYEALASPVMFQAGPLTGFKGIFKLPPGHLLWHADGQLKIQRYWGIHPTEVLDDEAAAVEELDGLLNRVVAGQMIADVPVGLMLSGGLDSSLVLALMAGQSRTPIQTFTIKYSDHDQKFERMPDDSRYAREAAKLFGCEHHEFEIEPDVVDLLPKMMWHLDEPLADPAAINTFLISQAARKNGVKVLLNGMGADEIFGGYRTQLACLLAGRYQRIPSLVRHGISAVVRSLPVATSKRGLRTFRWAKRFIDFADLPEDRRFLTAATTLSPEVFAQLFAGGRMGSLRYESAHYCRSLMTAFSEAPGSYLTRMCYAYAQYYLPDHNLNYSDKCTMAAGVEGRPPLVDHRIVEFVFKLTPRLRINRREQKYVLKRLAEKYLPKSIIYRPKAPFGSPLRSWIRGPLQPLVADCLDPAVLKKRGLYNANFVWQKIQNDRAGTEDNSHLIWTLLCNEMWFRRFFD